MGRPDVWKGSCGIFGKKQGQIDMNIDIVIQIHLNIESKSHLISKKVSQRNPNINVGRYQLFLLKNYNMLIIAYKEYIHNSIGSL